MTNTNQSLKLKYAPFVVGEKVRPHFAFLRTRPDFNIGTIKSIERGHSESGWVIQLEELPGPNQLYDTGWFFKIPVEPKPNHEMYAKVTEKFREFMIKELAANFDKGDRDGEKGWLEMTNKQLLSEIYYHTGKLQEALSNNNVILIKEYCADIANGALMCLDKYSSLL